MISRLSDAPTQPVLEGSRTAQVFVGPGKRVPDTIPPPPPEAPDAVPNDWEELPEHRTPLPMPEREPQPRFIAEAQTAEPAHLRHLLPEVEAHPLEAEVQGFEEPSTLEGQRSLTPVPLDRSHLDRETRWLMAAEKQADATAELASQFKHLNTTLDSFLRGQHNAPLDQGQRAKLIAGMQALCERMGNRSGHPRLAKFLVVALPILGGIGGSAVLELLEYLPVIVKAAGALGGEW